MNQQKRIFLVLAFIGFCLSIHAETLYYTHKGLHLKFAIDTETKEAMLGNGIDSEKNAIARPPLTDPWWNENPQTNYWKDIDVPSTIICEGTAYTRDGGTKSISRETYTVTSVAPSAFYKVTEVQTIKLPETIREIGSYAFAWCIYLRSVILPEQLSTIEGSCFWYCKALKSIHLPDNIRSISGQAFSDCENLEEINIPGNCVSIGNDAFTWCPKLHKVTIENGTESLSVGYSYSLGLNDGRLNPKASKRALFADCHIDTLYLGRNIICSCTNDNKPLSPFESTLNYSSYGSYYYNSTASYKKLEFGETVTEIADSLFYNVGLDFDIIFPQNLKRIGKDAFYWNVSRYFNPRRIEIPASVEYIGENAFRDNCIGELIFHEDGGSLTIGNYAFYDNEITSLTIPSTITNFGSQPFDKNKIKTLNLTEGLKKMCSIADANIFELTIPESMENISGDFGNSLRFIYCKPTTPPEGHFYNKAKVYVPSGTGQTYREHGWRNIIDPADDLLTINVKTAGTLYSRILAQDLNITDVIRLKLKGTLNDDDWATISDMSNLYDLDLSELNLENLPSGFFHNKTNLNKITFPNTLLSIEDNAFEGCTYLGGKMIIPASCISVGNRAFYGLNIGSVVFYGATTIQEEAFMDCTLLNEITLVADMTIGTNAFQSTALKELVIPANLKICDNAFNTASLKQVTINGGGQEIGDDVFGNGVETFTFNGILKSIGSFASFVETINVNDIYTWCQLPFANPVSNNHLCINGEEAHNVILPKEIEELRPYLFYGCPTIESISMSDKIQEIPKQAFADCHNLHSIVLPSKLMLISDSAFANCIIISNINIPSQVKAIKTGAFYGCINLKDIIFPNSLTDIGSGAFEGCSSLNTIELPSSINSIGEMAFKGCRRIVLLIAHWKEPITIANNTFERNSTLELYVPIGTAQKYVNAGWTMSNLSERGTLRIKVNNGGRVSYDTYNAFGGVFQYYFKPYKSFYLSLIPDNGYSVKRVRLNDEIVTSEVNNGMLFIEEPEEDIDMTIVFADNTIIDGDSNGDGHVDDEDAINTANYLLKKAPAPFYIYASDINEDEIINITDILLIISKKNTK